MNNTLLVNFYTELSSDFSKENSESFKCTIRLNSEHPIYKGHFPQIPIAPGVCLTQIIKEILMEKFQQTLIMTSGDNIKFLAMINPKETPELDLNFSVKTSGDSLEVSSNFSHNHSNFVKFKGKFKAL